MAIKESYVLYRINSKSGKNIFNSSSDQFYCFYFSLYYYLNYAIFAANGLNLWKTLIQWL